MPGLAVQTVASEAGGGVSLCGHVERRYITAEECQQTTKFFSDAVRAELQGETHRKEQSIPGSGTLVTAEQGLFGKEELHALNLNSKINREGKCIWPNTSGLGCS